jgi:transposase
MSVLSAVPADAVRASHHLGRSAMPTMPDQAGEVVLGVDTHEIEHVAALVDHLGRLLATRSFPASGRGFRSLLAWAVEHGPVGCAGVEGTGSFGAGLARFLAEHGIQVIEVTRPSRRARRHLGKTDTVDAEAAARMVLSGEATATPKRRDGIVESIRVLQIARRSAIKARTQAGQQIRSLIITAPSELNNALSGLSVKRQVGCCARFRPGVRGGAMASTQRVLRSLARRWQQLDREVHELERELHPLIKSAAPRLLAEPGVGPDTAGKLLVIASDNVDRLRSDAAFAALCGVSPIQASSGKTRRHRLNKGGDRQGNNALWTIANNRLLHDPETRAYAARRTAEGLSRREILRCLKRHLARRLYRLIVADLTNAAAPDLT